MIPLAILCSALTAPEVIGLPVELDVISIEDTCRFQGLTVRTTFTVSQEPDYHDAVTVLGTGHDDIERTAHIPVDWKVERGDVVTVIGKLTVIRHEAAVIDGRPLPGWFEIRLSPARPLR